MTELIALTAAISYALCALFIRGREEIKARTINGRHRAWR